MELREEVVNHKVFGKGKIVGFENSYLTVLFDESKLEKKFSYPSAIGSFLELENKSFLKEIQEDKNVIAQEEADNNRIKEEQEKLAIAIKSKERGGKRSNSTTGKTSDRNNIAFKCNYCDDFTENGDEKEKLMALRNINANSLAMLTTKLPNTKDKDRVIFEVFLFDDNYKGDNNPQGYVNANPKYKIQLSMDETKELKFWNYYFNEKSPEKILFGSGLHRYFTDDQAAQVLFKIFEIKKGTSEEELSREFLEYYCKVNNLDIDNIPKANGALQRIEMSS